MTILQEIAEKTKERIAVEEKKVSLAEIREKALECADLDEYSEVNPKEYSFYKALSKDKMNFICEVKKASPSKGIIAEDFPYLDIAMDYDRAGASAISCLTEPFWFLGSDEYLKEIVKNVSIPVLRKDFTVNEYMIYQAKAMGASAVLLICSILDDEQLGTYLRIVHELHLSALVETHDETEVERALKVGAGIIGVNNRNLKDFTVDTGNSKKLREMVPDDIIFVSESGIKSREDIAALAQNGTNAVLIGETLMRAANKKAKLEELKSLL